MTDIAQIDISLQIVSARERPDLVPAGDRLSALSWPAFLGEGEASKRYWDGLFDGALADFQHFAVTRLASGEERLVAASNSVPFSWPRLDDGTLPDRGWDAVIEDGVTAMSAGKRGNALSALAILVAPEYRSGAAAQAMIATMKTTAKQHGLSALVAPIRPTRKSDYPLTNFGDYLEWRTAADEPFDPWVRKHWRLGARMVRIAPQSMTISASIGEWEAWSKLRFCVDGPYHVPGGLAPVMIDREADTGTYLEPNVWMRHSL